MSSFLVKKNKQRKLPADLERIKYNNNNNTTTTTTFFEVEEKNKKWYCFYNLLFFTHSSLVFFFFTKGILFPVGRSEVKEKKKTKKQKYYEWNLSLQTFQIYLNLEACVLSPGGVLNINITRDLLSSYT